MNDVRARTIAFMRVLGRLISTLQRTDDETVSVDWARSTLAKLDTAGDVWRRSARTVCPDIAGDLDRTLTRTAQALRVHIAHLAALEARRGKQSAAQQKATEWRLLEQECAAIEAQQAAEERAEVARRQAEEAERAEEEAMISDMFSEVKILRIRPAS